jgi:hypothetical protein
MTATFTLSHNPLAALVLPDFAAAAWPPYPADDTEEQ